MILLAMLCTSGNYSQPKLGQASPTPYLYETSRLNLETFYRKRKVREIEEKNRPAGNDKWKRKSGQSRKQRGKQRRH